MVNRKSITYVFVSFTPRSGIFFQTLQYLLNQSSITDGCLSVMNFRIFHLISTLNSLKFRLISICVMFGRHDYPLSQFLRSDFFPQLNFFSHSLIEIRQPHCCVALSCFNP